jgi:LysR family transcriptional regulator, transcriptional activator of nhaA
MEWLNYHHLFYFWTVGKAGSIHKAGLELRISPPAISTQLKPLEDQFGEKLLTRSGRRLVLTEMGRTVFGYAEEIIALGRELQDVVKNRPVGRPLRLDVGVVDVLPKLVVQTLLESALRIPEPVRIVCREATSDQLLARLATHELDVVLSDSPLGPTLNFRAYSHLLGESGVIFVVGSKAANALRGKFRNHSIMRQCSCPLTTLHCGAILISGLNQTNSDPWFRVSSRTTHSSELSEQPDGVYFQCLQWCRSTSGNKRV